MGTGVGWGASSQGSGATGAYVAAAWKAREGMGSGEEEEGREISHSPHQLPREGCSDQVFNHLSPARAGKFPGETGCEQQAPGGDSGCSFSSPWGGSEHRPSCSLSLHRPHTAPVPKRPVPASPRTASALHAPESVRKSTSTGTASAPARAPSPPAWQSRGPARAGGSQGWGPGVATARGCPTSGVIGQTAPRLLASPAHEAS